MSSSDDVNVKSVVHRWLLGPTGLLLYTNFHKIIYNFYKEIPRSVVCSW